MAVIKGRSRGHGRALASYLLTQGENEAIRALDVDGIMQPSEGDLRRLLGDFSLNEQLTKSRHGLYHASINLGENDAATMSDAQWMKATELLAKELGFAEQRRAIVLHTKHGRTHCHCVFERYHHESGKMLPIAHNYRKHDRARLKIEQEFNHLPTSQINPRRPAMKETLTRLWHESSDANSFIKLAKQHGYMIAKGYDRCPFMVLDDMRAFNLVRHLDGIKTKEVRERFKNSVLMEEREAIAFIRTKQTATKTMIKTQPDRENFLQTLQQTKNKQQAPKLRMH